MTTDACRQIIGFMDECIAHYRALLSFETDKLRMISEDQVDTLIASLSKEEMLVMKTSSMEKNRLKLFASLGLDGKTYEQLVEETPTECITQMQAQQKEFKELVLELRRVNEVIAEMVKGKLNGISEHLRKEGNASVEQEMYTGSGAKTGDAGTSKLFRNA